MAIGFKPDLTKQQEYLEEQKRKADRMNQSIYPLLKLRDGTNKLRIMPAWTDTGYSAFRIYREYWVHWGVGADGGENRGDNYACPKKTEPYKGACPICAYVERLRATKAPEDWQIAKDLAAKKRVFFNAVDLFDPVWTLADLEKLRTRRIAEDKLPKVGDTKFQIFGTGTTIFTPILNLTDVDITDLDSGHNIVINKSGAKLLTDYQVNPELKPSKFALVGADLKLPDLDNLYEIFDEATLKAKLEGTVAVAPPSSPVKEPEQQSLPMPEPEPSEPATPAIVVEEAASTIPACFGQSYDAACADCTSDNCDCSEECQRATLRNTAKRSKKSATQTPVANAPAVARSPQEILEEKMRATLNR